MAATVGYQPTNLTKLNEKTRTVNGYNLVNTHGHATRAIGNWAMVRARTLLNRRRIIISVCCLTLSDPHSKQIKMKLSGVTRYPTYAQLDSQLAAFAISWRVMFC